MDAHDVPLASLLIGCFSHRARPHSIVLGESGVLLCDDVVVPVKWRLAERGQHLMLIGEMMEP